MRTDINWTAAGVALSFFSAWSLLVGFVFKIRGIAFDARDGVARIDKERAAALVEWGRRLERAEAVSGEMRGLAQSVANLSDTFRREMAMQQEQRDEFRDFTRTQLEDLKREMADARKNAAMARDLASGLRRPRVAQDDDDS